jgi:hypothetical protein
MRYLFCILFFITLSGAAAEVFFVPGWRTGFHGRDGCVRVLRDVYPGCEISVKSWNSKQSWQTTKKNAVIHTEKLLNEILQMPEARRRELILVGHSIGAKIVVDILNELRRRGMMVHSSALLGGALLRDDPAIASSLEAIRFYCCIVYNPHDWVLKILFPLDNRLHVPLGLYGWGGKDPRVFESCAPEERIGFFNHFAYIYLEELDRLVEKLPPVRLEVTVLQDAPNEVRIPADQVFWIDISSSGGWKLQSRKDIGKFRIIDDRGMRRAWGSESKMREAFADVELQLKRR